MSSFSITPVTNIPPPAAQEFPRFLLWQADGVDLGLSDADTVNVTGGLLATRGIGENSNVITLSGEGTPPTQIQFQEDGVDLGGPDADTLNFSTGITASRLGNTITVVVPDPPAPPAPIQWQDEGVDLGAADADTVDFVGAGVTATRVGDKVTVTIPGGGGGGNAISVLQVDSNPDPSGPIATFNDGLFTNWASGTVVVASEDWEWDFGTGRIHFINGGTYRVLVTSFVQAENEWPSGNSICTAYVDDDIGTQARTHTNGDSADSQLRLTWTDQVILVVPEDSLTQIGLHSLASTDQTQGILFARMTFSFEKLA